MFIRLRVLFALQSYRKSLIYANALYTFLFHCNHLNLKKYGRFILAVCLRKRRIKDNFWRNIR